MQKAFEIENTFEAQNIIEVSLGRIRTNPRQPRKQFDDEGIRQLADSIIRYGILQPITCREIDGGLYEIIAGERRYRAAKLAGFYSVPVITLETSEEESAELAIIENLQRKDLNIFEEAGAISSLIFIYRITQGEAAEKLSVSQSYIANKLRLLRFTEDERKLILENSLSERHARCLLRINGQKERLSALKYIISHHLNVASSEKYIDGILSQEKKPKKLSGKFACKDLRLFYNTLDRAAEMIRLSGVPVKIKKEENRSGAFVTVAIGNVGNITDNDITED